MIWFVDIAESKDLIAGCDESHNIYVWDLSSMRIIHRLRGHTARVYNLRFVAEGERLLTAGEDRQLKIWSMNDGTELFSYTYPHAYEGANFLNSIGLSESDRDQLCALGALV